MKHFVLRLTPLELDVAESWLSNSLNGARDSKRAAAAARVVEKLNAARGAPSQRKAK